MKKHLKPGLFILWAGAVASAFAQLPEEGLVSFGRRTPTMDEVGKALGVVPGETAAQPEAPGTGMKTRGIALGSSATRAGSKLKAMDMDVQFGFGSDSLSPRAKAQLAPLGDYLKTAQLDGKVVVIEGHTDALGSVDFANELSARRAQTVRDFLVAEYKINPQTFVVVGRGKQIPKDPGNVASEANRRIQFHVRAKE